MTTMPGHRPAERAPGIDSGGPDAPVTLVLSREVRIGHEQAFEAILRELAAEVRRQPGHLDVTVLRPPAGSPPIYTIVSHFAHNSDADSWLSSEIRARLVAEAGLHSVGALQTRYLSGLEGWLADPRAPVLITPPRWKIAVVSAAAILPLLEAIGYLLAPHLNAMAVWVRPFISVALVIPLMQYLVMPLVTRATRAFLYRAQPKAAISGQPD